MSKKHNYEYVKNYIESLRYKLLSTGYSNNKELLDVICPNGHNWKVSFNAFVRNRRCMKCSGKEKHSIDEIRQNFEKEGYTLLSENYVNNKTKLHLRCPKGHDWEVRYDVFLSGNRCLECSGKKKYSYDYIKDYIESFGYKLLSTEYKNAFGKLKIECPAGHIFLMKWNNFHQGQRCPECYLLSKPFTYDYVKKYIESFGYKLLSTEYKNCKNKLNVECDKNHKYSVSFNCFQQGERCPFCSKVKFYSNGEKDLLSEVEKKYCGTIIPNDRTQIINPKTGHYLELDIWLPELKKAIEYNGTYWHRDVQRDELKQNLCKMRGIKLLVIDELSWMQNKSNCINRVLSFIGD
jgi:hypothetical protein